MGARLRKSPDPMNEWTTCRARERVNDRKKRWREIGNQFVDLLWSSGKELGQAETKIAEQKEKVVIEFQKGVTS